MNQDRKCKPDPNSLCYQLGQLPYLLNMSPTKIKEWVDSGKLTYFTLDDKKTKLFLRETIIEILRREFRKQNPEEDLLKRSA